MSRMSVAQAAERLAVSPARVRQRIDDGSLVAEKLGGRWLVDLEASQSAPAPRGRPVAPSLVWWSLASAEVTGAAADAAAASASPNRRAAQKPGRIGEDLLRSRDAAGIRNALAPAVGVAALHKSLLRRMRLAEIVIAESSGASGSNCVDDCGSGAVNGLDVLAPHFAHEAMSMSRSSRSRAVNRFVQAVAARDYPALLAWLGNRGPRNLYVVAHPDLGALRSDERLLLSGVSHPDSNLEDPRIVEAYVCADDLDDLVDDYWLDKLVVGERPNVVLHVAPVRPHRLGAMLLAADLAEHGGPREVQRAHEILEEAIDALVADDEQAPV